MKKVFYMLAVLLFTSSVSFAQKAVEGNVNDSRILRQLSKDAVKDPVYLKGSLESWVTANNEFVVYAETKEKKYLFVLQMETARKIKPATGNFKELTFLGDSMVLSDGKQVYYFGLEPVAEDENMKRVHLTEKDFASMVDGYGLAQHNVPAGSKHYQLDKMKAAKSIYDYLDKENK